MQQKYKRINILIKPEQHRMVMEQGLSLSGLVRDLLDDRFSDTSINLCVNKKTRKLYDRIISNFGISDQELERFFVEALDKFLIERSREIDTLRKRMQEKPGKG